MYDYKSDLEHKACHCIMCNKYKNAELAKMNNILRLPIINKDIRFLILRSLNFKLSTELFIRMIFVCR